MNRLTHLVLAIAAIAIIPHSAFAHVGIGATASFIAGLEHPFSGLDHIAAMVAVGLWAALKGGRALWLWPVAFVSAMLCGGALGMAYVAVPFVEPGILASVVVLGLLVALAADLPLPVGAAIIAMFAIFHGHAHGTEVAETMNGAKYMAGFALSTAMLHLAGIAAALSLAHQGRTTAIRATGAACVVLGLALAVGVV
ncbi:MAG: HupE/UreJ family protein [Pseudolabrys sp.]|nr:HupE/UreJ family protein [Pseudolabrys sp.]